MCDTAWKNKFAKKLLNLHSENDLLTAIKVIKCHEKNLSVAGDFSCPGKKETWKKVLKTNCCETNDNDLEAVARSLLADVQSIAEKYSIFFH